MIQLLFVLVSAIIIAASVLVEIAARRRQLVMK